MLAPALLAVLAIELAGCLWLARNFYPLGYYNDDASFLGQARAFATTGRLYSAPWDALDGLPLQPPGQALWLSPWALLFPHSDDALQVVEAGATLVTAGLLGALALPDLGPAGAILVATLFIANGPSATNGSTLMSDIPFGLLTVGCLLYTDRRLRDTPSALLLGLAIGCTLLLRIVGVATLAAAALLLLLRRQGRQCLVLVAGAVAVYLPYALEQRVNPTADYVGVKQKLLLQSFSDPHYLVAWFSGFSHVLGGDYTALGAACLPIALVLVLWGVWKVRQPLLPAFLLFYLLATLAWPFANSRYYLVWWPLCLLVAARGLPRPAALLTLSLAWLVSLPGLIGTIQVSTRVPELTLSIHDAETWVARRTPSQATIITPAAYQFWLFSGRHVYEQGGSKDLLDFTFQVATEDPTLCVVDYDHRIVKTVFGEDQISILPHLSDWLDCSTSYRKLFATPWQAVYRLTVPRGHVLVARKDLDDAVAADAAGDERRAQALLDAALALWPDFPEARKFRATLTQPDFNALRQILQQYPMDFDLAKALAHADRQNSRSVLERSLQLAEAYHDRAAPILRAALHPPTP
jgi:hypothetical protein